MTFAKKGGYLDISSSSSFFAGVPAYWETQSGSLEIDKAL